MNDSLNSSVEQLQAPLNEVGLDFNSKIPRMMQIDTNSSFEKVFCFILVFVINLIIAVASFNFHSQIHTNTTLNKIPIDEKTFKTEVVLNNMNPFNRFSYLQIKFRRIEGNLDQNLKIHINFQILSSNEKLESSPKINSNNILPLSNQNYIVSQSTDIIHDIIFKKNNIESENLILFKDKMLSSKEYKLCLKLSCYSLKLLSYVKINWNYGDCTITYVIIIIRSIYLLVMLFLFCLYSKLIYRFKYRNCMYEQQLTYILIILCLLSNYPLENIYIGSSTCIIMIFSVLFNSIFQSFLLFYIISIFKCIISHAESEKFRYPFFVIILFILIAMIDASASILMFISTFINDYSTNFIYIHYIPIICRLFNTLIAIIFIFITSASIDQTEFSRFTAYLSHTILMFFITLPVKFLKNKIQISYIASLIETTSCNLFVVSMCYFHWTYSVMQNTSYQDSSMQESHENMMIEKFSDNENVVASDISEDIKE